MTDCSADLTLFPVSGKRGVWACNQSARSWLVDTAHRTARRSHSGDSPPSARGRMALRRRGIAVWVTVDRGTRLHPRSIVQGG